MSKGDTMYLVTGDISGPKLHSTWGMALEDIVSRCKSLPRWKHPRHGRKQWQVYRMELDGSTTFSGGAYSYIEHGYIELPVEGAPFKTRKFSIPD